MLHARYRSLVLHVVALTSFIPARSDKPTPVPCTVTHRRLSCTQPDTISEIPKLDRKQAKNIREIYICCQKNLSKLSSTLVSRYPYVEEITIRDSALRIIDKDAFQALKHLRKLDLGGNKIESFNWKLLERRNMNVALLLQGNPLKCSCENKWLRRLVPGGKDDPITCTMGPTEKESPINKVNIPDCEIPRIMIKTLPLEAKEGDTITVTCTGSAYPVPSVTWIPPKYVAVRPIDLTRDHGNSMSSSLTLQVQPEHHGLWNCSSENLAGKAVKSGYISVYSAPEIRLLQLERWNSPCINYRVRGWPRPKVTWYKDDKLLRILGKINYTAKQGHAQNVMVGCLTFTSPTLKDNGNYTLRAINNEGQAERTILVKLVHIPAHLPTPRWQPRPSGETSLVTKVLDVTVNPEPQQTSVWVLVVVLIAASLVLLLAGATVCLYYVRRRQGRHKFKSIVAWQTRSGSLFSDGDGGAMNIDQLTRELMPLSTGSMLDNPHYSTQYPADSSAKSIRSGDMKLVRVLGEGAFGRVYLGRWSGDSGIIPVAVKMAKNDLKSATRREFENEAELMTSLKHPNIVTFYGICSEENSLFLVFEYMDEGDLNNFLRVHGPDAGVLSDQESDVPPDTLTHPELMNIAHQVACGMEYLACQHFVHRDLATRNCLVTGKLVVKIGDFGMSRDVYSTDYYRVGGQAMLPVRWMPPESLMYRKFTVESDVWSYGVVLWEIFTYGRQPWFEYANHEVMELVRQGQVLPRPQYCPNDLYDVMLGCWKKKPAERLKMKEISAFLKKIKQPSHAYLQLVD